MVNTEKQIGSIEPAARLSIRVLNTLDEAPGELLLAR